MLFFLPLYDFMAQPKLGVVQIKMKRYGNIECEISDMLEEEKKTCALVTELGQIIEISPLNMSRDYGSAQRSNCNNSICT